MPARSTAPREQVRHMGEFRLAEREAAREPEPRQRARREDGEAARADERDEQQRDREGEEKQPRPDEVPAVPRQRHQRQHHHVGRPQREGDRHADARRDAVLGREADPQQVAAGQDARGLTGEEARRRVAEAHRNPRRAHEEVPPRDLHHFAEQDQRDDERDHPRGEEMQDDPDRLRLVEKEDRAEQRSTDHQWQQEPS